MPQDDDITLNPKPLPGWEDDAVGLVPRPAGMETPGGEEEGTLPSSAAQAGAGGTHSNSSGEERQEGGEDGVGEGDTEEAEGAVSAGQRSSAGEGYSGEGLQGGGGQQEGGAGGVSVGQLAASGKMVEEEEVFAEDEAFDDFASAKAGVYKV